MSTAASIITLALKDIGVLDESETPSSATMSDALTTLNQMLALWQVDRQFIYGSTETTFNPDGSETYTIGTGGVINVARPTAIDYAFYRLTSVDYPIKILSSIEEFKSITYKDLTTFPDVLYYNPTYALGVISIYPQPTTGAIHLGYSVALPQYTASADSITLPPEYDMVIRFSLAEILAETMGRSASPTIVKLAQSARRQMRRNNNRIIPLTTVAPYRDPMAPILSGNTYA